MSKIIQQRWFNEYATTTENVILPDNRDLCEAFRWFRIRMHNMRLTQDKLIITSGRDGAHSERSSHYVNNAVDIRIRNLDGAPDDFSKKDYEIAMKMIEEFYNRYNNHFWFLMHKTHLHMQYIGYPIRIVEPLGGK